MSASDSLASAHCSSGFGSARHGLVQATGRQSRHSVSKLEFSVAVFVPLLQVHSAVAPCVFFMFLGLNISLKGSYFESFEDIHDNVRKDFFAR
jgi:hypothetical protein